MNYNLKVGLKLTEFNFEVLPLLLCLVGPLHIHHIPKHIHIILSSTSHIITVLVITVQSLLSFLLLLFDLYLWYPVIHFVYQTRVCLI